MADFLNVEFSKDCPGASVIAAEPMLSSYIMTPKDGDEDSKNLMYIENLSSINTLYSTSSGLSIENDLQEVSMVSANGVPPSSLIQYLPNSDQEATGLEESSQLLKNDSPYYSYLRLPPSSSAQEDPGIQIYSGTNSIQSASQEKNELSDEMILRFVNHSESLKQQKSLTTAITKLKMSSTYAEGDADENFDSVSTTNNLVYSESGPAHDEVGDYINHEPSCSTGLNEQGLETTTTKKQQQVVIVTQDSAVKPSESKSPPTHHSEDEQQHRRGDEKSSEPVQYQIVTVDLLLSDGDEETATTASEENELETEAQISKAAPLRVEISSRRKKSNICANNKHCTEANQTAPKSSSQYSKGGKRKNLLADMQNEAESPRAKKRRALPTETVAKPFKCSRCHLKFAEQDIIELHEKCHVKDRKSFHCCYANCSVTFPNWVKMYHHLFTHGLRKPHKCNECSFTCISRSDLTTHAYVHAQVKSWKCEKCRRTFKHRRNLLAHERQCRGLSSSGKPLVDENLKFECNVCHKQLANKRNLDKHMEIHTNVKPFVCQFCGHSTRLKESLIMHKRLHTGEKPFKCDKCDYSTPDKSSLRRHKRRHNNDKPYKCNQCEYSCIQKHCLDTHIRRAHTGEQFLCEFCRYVTPNRYALNQHRKRHIKIFHPNHLQTNGQQPATMLRLSDVIPSFSNVDNNANEANSSGAKSVVIQLDVDQSPIPYRSTRKIRDGQQVSQTSNKSINDLVEEGSQQQQGTSTTSQEHKSQEDETVIVVSDHYDTATQNEDDGSFVLSADDFNYIAAQLEKQQDDNNEFKNNGGTQEVWLPRRDGRMIVIQFGGSGEEEQPNTTAHPPPSTSTHNTYHLTYQQKRS